MPAPRARRKAPGPKPLSPKLGHVARVVLIPRTMDEWLKRQAALDARSVSSFTRQLFKREMELERARSRRAVEAPEPVATSPAALA